MLSKVCNKIVNLLIQNHIIQKDDREIYYFGLYQMISFIFNTITTLVIVYYFVYFITYYVVTVEDIIVNQL